VWNLKEKRAPEPEAAPLGTQESAALTSDAAAVEAMSQPPGRAGAEYGSASQRAVRQRTGLSRMLQRRRTATRFRRELLRRSGPPPDPQEREADRAAQYVLGGGEGGPPQLTPAGLRIQGLFGLGALTSPPTEARTQTPPSPPGAPVPDEGAKAGPIPALIVEDAATDVAPDHMRKSDFFSQAREAMLRAAEEELAGTIWSAVGCPYLGRWLAYYARRSASQMERAIQKHAPGAARVTRAQDYIPLLCHRVRRGVRTWLETGEAAGVPSGVQAGASAEGGDSGDVAPEAGAGLAGGILYKEGERTPPADQDPRAIQAQLGEGHTLDPAARSRMESAFGIGFGNVRVHADDRAADLSADLGARAFTVGRDIAFARNEYQPNTLVGDALIAHELAHTVQQGGGAAAFPMQKSTTEAAELEGDADGAALRAMASKWLGGEVGARLAGLGAISQLRTGLRLQACRDKEQGAKKATHSVPVPRVVPPADAAAIKRPKAPPAPAEGRLPKPPKHAELKALGSYCSLYKIKKGDTYGGLVAKFSEYAPKKYFDRANGFTKLTGKQRSSRIKAGLFVVVPHWSTWTQGQRDTMKSMLEAKVAESAETHSIPAHILKGMVDKESGWLRKSDVEPAEAWDPCAMPETALGHKAAAGLMQFLASTARSQGLEVRRGYKTPLARAIDQRLDPQFAIDAGARYLRSLFDMFPRARNETEQWRCALAAYNQGSGAVTAARRSFTNKNPRQRYDWVHIAAEMSREAGRKARAYVSTILGTRGDQGGLASHFR
jgi:hypothetical protein